MRTELEQYRRMSFDDRLGEHAGAVARMQEDMRRRRRLKQRMEAEQEYDDLRDRCEDC